MTLFLWLLTALGFLLWSLAGAAMGWSIWALSHGWMTTSQFMSQLPPVWVFAVGISVGLVVGFVAGHWWWPISK